MPNGSHRWLFTFNNPDPNAETVFRLLATSQEARDASQVKGLAFQREIAPNTGTPHFQGFVVFSVPRTLTQLQRLEWVHTLEPRLTINFPQIHWDSPEGSPKQCVAYCTKLDSRDPGWGEPIVVGCLIRYFSDGGRESSHLKRGQVVDFLVNNPDAGTSELIDAGGLEIMATQPNLIGAVRTLLLQDSRRAGVTCDLFAGPTGVGKSRLADSLYPSAYRKNSGKWWDGYQGEPVAILDDFDSSSFPVGDFLRLVDRYPYRAEVKGGTIPIVSTHFVITSNHFPSEWYPDAEFRRRRAVERRIDRVFLFSDDGTITVYNDYFGVVRDVGTPYLPPWLAEL